ncbi:hypothetical protein QZH46_06560 [Pseudomonas corrugata]
MNLLQTLKAKLLRALAKRMKAKFVYDPARYPLRSVDEQYIPTTWGLREPCSTGPMCRPGNACRCI